MVMEVSGEWSERRHGIFFDIFKYFPIFFGEILKKSWKYWKNAQKYDCFESAGWFLEENPLGETCEKVMVFFAVFMKKWKKNKINQK